MGKPYEVRKQPEMDFVFKDVFSLEHLYKGIHGWLEEEGYINSPGATPDKWMEHNYIEKVSGGGAREIWILWRIDREIGPYFKFHFDIDYHVLGLSKKEIMYDGKKIKLDSGEVEIWIKPVLTFDPKGEWSDSLIFKNKRFAEFFKKRLFKKELEAKEELLVKDSKRLLDFIKQYFELRPFLDEYTTDPFKPAKGKGL